MNVGQRLIIAWAALRVTYLDKLHRYDDGFTVSQEFYESTTSFNVDPEGLNAATVKVPTFNKENRTS